MLTASISFQPLTESVSKVIRTRWQGTVTMPFLTLNNLAVVPAEPPVPSQTRCQRPVVSISSTLTMAPGLNVS